MPYRAQVVFPNNSGKAEDVAVNTFHFAIDPPNETASIAALDTALIAFYNGGGTGAFCNFLSNQLSRTSNAAQIKWYNLADAPPRVPITTTSWTLSAAGTASSLPPQVALAISFQGVKVSGFQQARRRGRIFLGPFGTNANDTAGGEPGRPVLLLRNGGVSAMQGLRTAAIAANSPWVVYSPTGLTSASVESGWVDNSWDVQRRRKVDSTARSTFGTL